LSQLVGFVRLLAQNRVARLDIAVQLGGSRAGEPGEVKFSYADRQ
jgi:hypothetical protein